MEERTYSAKDGWLRIKFIVRLKDGRIEDVEYSASRCKTLRALADRVAQALKGAPVEDIGEAVLGALKDAQVPPNRENRARLILKAFGLEDG
ncbi:MAG: hypothetical protein GXO29_02065 [Thermotogae bacterium]|nr:hypothetical protein [Thermotogota bacterium]